MAMLFNNQSYYWKAIVYNQRATRKDSFCHLFLFRFVEDYGGPLDADHIAGTENAFFG